MGVKTNERKPVALMVWLDKAVDKKMREKKIRRKGDISLYIEHLIKKDLGMK